MSSRRRRGASRLMAVTCLLAATASVVVVVLTTLGVGAHAYRDRVAGLIGPVLAADQALGQASAAGRTLTPAARDVERRARVARSAIAPLGGSQGDAALSDAVNLALARDIAFVRAIRKGELAPSAGAAELAATLGRGSREGWRRVSQWIPEAWAGVFAI